MITKDAETGREIPSEEMKWTGLDDLLKERAQQGKPLTKQEVLDHLKENQVQLKEVIKGDVDIKLNQTPSDADQVPYGHTPEGTTAHSLPITDNMRDSVIKIGQPMFGNSAPDEPAYVTQARLDLANSFKRKGERGSIGEKDIEGKQTGFLDDAKDFYNMGLIAGHKISQQIKGFAGWANQMRKQMGDAITPHLESIWSKVQGAQSKIDLALNAGDTSRDTEKGAINVGGMGRSQREETEGPQEGRVYSGGYNERINANRAARAARGAAGVPNQAASDAFDQAVPNAQTPPAGGRAGAGSYTAGENQSDYKPEPADFKQWWKGKSTLQKASEIANTATAIKTSFAPHHAFFKQNALNTFNRI